MANYFPLVSCICPTYKRPQQLRNALACFLAQDYPESRCELIILDDAGQFPEQIGTNWRLISTRRRFENLPSKFNALLKECRGDIVAVWEDDDVFLPWHLRDVVHCYQGESADIYLPRSVWTNYHHDSGELVIEEPAGRFHSSWRFTRRIVEAVGGYPESSRLDFDQELGGLLRQSGEAESYGEHEHPSYVYRWGSAAWNASQGGNDTAFQELWNELGKLPAQPQSGLVAGFDEETFNIFCRFAG